MQSAANLNESPIEVMKHKTPRTLLLPLFAMAAITILAFDPQWGGGHGARRRPRGGGGGPGGGGGRGGGGGL